MSTRREKFCLQLKSSSCLLSRRPFFLKVKDIVLKSGKVIPADVLIVGIGKRKHFTQSLLLSNAECWKTLIVITI